MSRFIVFDGNVVAKDEVNLSHLFWDESFSLSQKIWFGFGGIPLFSENIELLVRQIEALHLALPESFKNIPELFRVTKRMLNKNRYYRSGLVHFQLFWNFKQITFIISDLAFTEFDFPISKQGLLLNFSALFKNSRVQYNRYLFYNQKLWKVAEAQLQDSNFNNSIFLNERDAVCECVNANIFLIKENVLFTPSLQTGCFDDTLRNTILEIAVLCNLKIVESEKLKVDDVLKMDEVFLGSEERGIQRVIGVENRRYVHVYSEKIHEKLNEYLKNKVKGSL